MDLILVNHDLPNKWVFRKDLESASFRMTSSSTRARPFEDVVFSGNPLLLASELYGFALGLFTWFEMKI